MGKITSELLQKIMPHAVHAEQTLPYLNSTAQQYEINNERRMAAWLATLAVESAELRYQEEIASGAAYEGRTDLGNTEPGDGKRFKGHGRIQITGRANHQAYTNYLRRSKHLPFVDFITNPRELAQEPYATDSAGWFWAVYKKLNPIADNGDFLTTQIRVNGKNKKTGLPNNWKERNGYWIKALTVLPAGFSLNGLAPQLSSATDTQSETPAVKPESSDEVPIDQGGEFTEGEKPPVVEQPVVQQPVVEVQSVTAAPESPIDKTISKWSSRFVAIPGAAVLTFLAGVATWIASSPANLTETLIIASAAIAIIYVIGRQITTALTDARTARIQREREARAHELMMLTARSATDPGLNTIRIVSPPSTELPNSGATPEVPA